MIEVVNVRFRNKGKFYYFDPAGHNVLAGESVIVETVKGLELGECTCGNHEVDDERVIQPLRPVVRVATAEDKAAAEENMKKEESAFKICQQKIKEHALEMKLVDVEYNFEGSKIMFFFTSDGRVDFRELVKDLATVFRTRIELRQIGVRDEAKMLGGLGVCGRPFCCSSFLDEFQPVSIKMAKTQSLSLNPTKISGTCGRLMCCLKYEQDAYEYLIKTTPKVNSEVETPAGKGTVIETNLLRRVVKVRVADDGDDTPKQFKVSELGGNAVKEFESEQKTVKASVQNESIAALIPAAAEIEEVDKTEKLVKTEKAVKAEKSEKTEEARKNSEDNNSYKRRKENEKKETEKQERFAEQPQQPKQVKNEKRTQAEKLVQKSEKNDKTDKSEKIEKIEKAEKNIRNQKNRQRNQRRQHKPAEKKTEEKIKMQKNMPKESAMQQNQSETIKQEKPVKAIKQDNGRTNYNHHRRRPNRKPQGDANNRSKSEQNASHGGEKAE